MDEPTIQSELTKIVTPTTPESQKYLRYTKYILVAGVSIVLVAFASYLFVLAYGTPQKSAYKPYVAPTSTTPIVTTGQTVNLFFIALNDNGKTGKRIGCGDSVIPVETKIPTTTTPLHDALSLLLAQHDRFVGDAGLVNILSASKLILKDVSIDTAGVATVNLEGTTSLGGVCDDPRFEAQLTETVLQFPTVKRADIFINGKTLQSVISEKGE